MSICQSERDSCVACCGTLNLRLSPSVLRGLLYERTLDLSGVDLSDHRELVGWREARESIEESLPRRDPLVYVCPFVGWVSARRAGCLIHPERTLLPRSQDASFYGASICQAYDCPARERDRGRYASLASKVAAGDSLTYSRIVGDGLLFRLFELVLDQASVGDEGTGCRLSPLEDEVWLALFLLRLGADSGPTSFELPGISCPTVEDLLSELFPDERRLDAERLLVGVLGERTPSE